MVRAQRSAFRGMRASGAKLWRFENNMTPYVLPTEQLVVEVYVRDLQRSKCGGVTYWSDGSALDLEGHMIPSI